MFVEIRKRKMRTSIQKQNQFKTTGMRNDTERCKVSLERNPSQKEKKNNQVTKCLLVAQIATTKINMLVHVY